MAQKTGPKVIGRRRCLEEGCEAYGVWQDVYEGEEYLLGYPDPEPGRPFYLDKRSHQWKHYAERQAAYERRRAEAIQQARDHYRATGEMIRPDF